MPWPKVDIVSLRQEFVQLSQSGCVGIAELCRRFGVSRKTGYKWLDRHRSGADLADRSRRPRVSPSRTAEGVEARILELRQQYPSWGGRKLRQLLINEGLAAELVPAASTVSGILRRHGLIDPEAGDQHKAWKRFEHEAPNDLWQMDFLGHFAAGSQRCYTLTALDDHSRFNLILAACADQSTQTVQGQLTTAFRRYGLPLRMTMDNGGPWGNNTAWHDLTPLTVWLMRLGIGVSHSRPYHPQTQGKDERFHRTLRAEVLGQRQFGSIEQVQAGLDRWRPIYNTIRPHEALAMQRPQQRYRPSPRSYPEQLPPLEYDAGDALRKVQAMGWIRFARKDIRLPKALKGQVVALRATTQDGVYNVYFGTHHIKEIDLRDKPESKSNV